MSAKIIDNGAKLLSEAGLLFRINRTVLHPLGLALYVTQNDDGTFHPGIGLMEWDEPVEFAPDPERDRDREARYASFVHERLQAFPQVSERIQGVDCPECEHGIAHIHRVAQAKP